VLLAGKVALVTGASRGIGKAIAVSLGKEGATVLGTATSPAGADSISEHFSSLGISGRGYPLDVNHFDAIADVLNDIGKNFGLPDILVNNAAITRDNLLLRMKVEEWDHVINTNLNAVYHLTKSCIRRMLKARWGRIINLGSIVGTTGNPGQVNYSATKSALIGFSKSLAQEVASRGITVNVVAPGFIATDMTKILSDDQRELLLSKIPMQRLGQPEDVANTVLFLASDLASYITGQTIHVNGGMYMA
jgi:3-oxoacyl-[acyl-carrier protein] reductase